MPGLREQLEAAVERRDALYKPAKDTEQGRAMLARLAWDIQQVGEAARASESALDGLRRKLHWDWQDEPGSVPGWQPVPVHTPIRNNFRWE